MTDISRLSARVARFTVVASFIAVLVLVVLYVTHFSRADFSSDDAVLSMLAESIAQQGTLFPQGWVSNNGDLMLPSGALILAPLLTWFSNSFALHAVAGLFAVALMLVSFFAFLKTARLPIPVILLATATLATGPSRLFAIMIFLQTTYVWLSAGFFLSATLIWKRHSVISAEANQRSVYLLALAAIILVLVFPNPGRAVVMLVFPLYAFDRVLALHSTRSESTLRHYVRRLGLNDTTVLTGLALPCLLASIFYYGLFHFGAVETVHNASRLYWDGPDSIGTHADVFFRNWLPSLGGGSEFIASDGLLERILRPLRILFSIWLTWVGVAEVLRLHRNRNALRTALTVAWLAALIPILFMFIAFAPLAIDTSTMRYFTVPILLLLAMAAVRVSHASDWWIKSAPLVAILMSGYLIAVASVRFVPAATDPNMGFLQTRSSYASRLADLLVRENLQWGYASWWNAGATTVLSGGMTRVSPVYESGQDLLPFNYMIQRRWYQPGTWTGETFLVLSQGEATTEKLASLTMTLGSATRTITSDEFTILVYDWNIAANFSCDQSSATQLPIGADQPRGDIMEAKLRPKSSLRPENVVDVLIRNRGSQTLGGLGEAAISMTFDLLSGTGNASTAVLMRVPLPCAIHPGETRSMRIELPEPPEETEAIRVSLVQRTDDSSQVVEGSTVEIPYQAGLSPKIFHESFDRAGDNK